MQIKEVDVEKTEIFSIGRQYSHNVLVIHFVNLPNIKNKYIYYKIDDIEEEIPLVSDLFIVSRPLTMHSGKVKAQIIVRDEANETIGLTKNFTMIIKASNYSGIGEDENYPDDLNIKNYFVKIDEKVNSFEELANLVQTKLDNGEFIGAQGPKGDPGDVTEEYRNLAMQIAQNASDAQTSATNAQVSATAARKSLDDAKEFVNQTKTELNQIKNDTSALKEEANTSATNAQKALDDTKEFANQTKSEMNQIKTDTELLKNEANTSAVNAKASENKAKEYADKLQISTDDISQLKEDLVANTKKDAKTKRSLSALWDLNNGISYRFETDSEKAYKKQIPSGAKLGSVNKVGGQIVKQDDALLISAVNDVVEKGRNLFDCYGFSSKVILHINSKREFTNDYGTSISTIELANKVIATQTQAPDSYTTSSNNGFFYIGIKNMESAKKYILSFDFTPTKMLLESGSLLILVNGRFPSSPVSIGELNVKKRIAFPFEYKVVDDRQFLEIRLAGMSGIFENFQLDEGNIETAYTPYYAPISHPIPQSIQNLDGYGWSAGQAYNYVDFENKKYYKCVDKRAYQSNDDTDSNVITDGTNTYYELAEAIVTDISDIIGDTFQEPFEVETGGSLTFKNTNGDGYRIAVPSDIQYVVALSEVNE